MGASRLLNGGTDAALRSVLFGLVLGLPWALANIAAGSELNHQDSIRQW